MKGGADAVVAVTGPAINANNENNRVVSAVLCSALYPNIVKVLLSVRSFDHIMIFKGLDTRAEIHANSNRSNGQTSQSGGFKIQNCCWWLCSPPSWQCHCQSCQVLPILNLKESWFQKLGQILKYVFYSGDIVIIIIIIQCGFFNWPPP